MTATATVASGGATRISSIEELLREARSRLRRLTPGAALAATHKGAVIVDIRPDFHRVTEGRIPGALIIERNVLEWRLDPASEARLPIAHADLQVIVVCNEGYTSSLAAAALHDLGLSHATDIVGGYRAWRAAGLPVITAADEARATAPPSPAPPPPER